MATEATLTETQCAAGGRKCACLTHTVEGIYPDRPNRKSRTGGRRVITNRKLALNENRVRRDAAATFLTQQQSSLGLPVAAGCYN